MALSEPSPRRQRACQEGTAAKSRRRRKTCLHTVRLALPPIQRQMQMAAFWFGLLQLVPLSYGASPAPTAHCVCFVKLRSKGDHSPETARPESEGLRCAAAEPGLLRCRRRSTPCGRVRRPPGLQCFGNGAKRIGGGEQEQDYPWHVRDAPQLYLACVFGACGPACAFCARVQPGSGIDVSLRAVEYSPFLVGIEWRRILTVPPLESKLRNSSAREYHLGVTTCWSWENQPCKLRCSPEERVKLVGNSGSFSVPADLYSGSVQLRVRNRGQKGPPFFRAAFHRKQIEPSPPCDVTVHTVGWSMVRLNWKTWPHARLDGFEVSWCRSDSMLPRACSTLYLPRNVSSVVLVGLMPFLRYRYKVRSYKGDPNASDLLYSTPSIASRKHWLSFELFLYMEMLIVFLLAGTLALVALVTIGFILTRALALAAFLDVEPVDLVGGAGFPHENQAQGDHRLDPLGRRRGATALSRIHSRGDS
ncbi:uncharacterized protein [Dermacentor albipictus]|uniref:uncharacterized protein isoform X2 n=1 Tax=Dermacentor albipictus TaxID=60249 RepID=UPI0038FCAC5E